MRILNIGLDKTLVGGKGTGDAVERHRRYAQSLDSLDIIVYTKDSEQLPVFQIADNAKGYPTNSKNKFFFIFDALRLSGQIHKLHPFDIVLAQDPLGSGFAAYLVAFYFGCKLQINFHGDFWDNEYWLKAKPTYRFLIPFSRYLVRRADGIRVVSEGIRQKLIKQGIAESKIALIPTPVNKDRFLQPINNESAASIEKYRGEKVVLFVGRLEPEKNLSQLISIVPALRDQVPQFKLLLVGDGSEKGMLSQLVSELGVAECVEFVETQTPETLVGYYRLASVVVLASFTESYGKILIEAAFSKRPVVATRTTGSADIVEEGVTGYLVEIGNTEQLKSRILTLLQDVKLAKQMGERGFVLASQKFDDKKIVADIVGFWKKILKT